MLLTEAEVKVLRRLAKGPARSVDRIVANRLHERGLVARVPMVSWTYCITDAGRLAVADYDRSASESQ